MFSALFTHEGVTTDGITLIDIGQMDGDTDTTITPNSPMLQSITWSL